MWESSQTSLHMNLIPECERRQIGVEFLVETDPSQQACWRAAQVWDVVWSKPLPAAHLCAGRHQQIPAGHAHVNNLERSQERQLWNHHAARSPFVFRLAVQPCIIDGLPPSSPALLPQSSCALLSWSRCRGQRGAGAADLQAVRSCFFSCILPSTNGGHLILV